MQHITNFNITIGSDPEFVLVRIKKDYTDKSIYNPTEMFLDYNDVEYVTTTHTEVKCTLKESDSEWLKEAINKFIYSLNIFDILMEVNNRAIDYAIFMLYGIDIDKFLQDFPEYRNIWSEKIATAILWHEKENKIMNEIKKSSYMDEIAIDIYNKYRFERVDTEYYKISQDMLTKLQTLILSNESIKSEFYTLMAEEFYIQYITKQCILYSMYDEVPNIVTSEKFEYYLIESEEYYDLFKHLEYEEEAYEVEDENDGYEDDSLLNTEIGCDSNSVIGELRPKYGRTPIEHFNEIKGLIENIYIMSGNFFVSKEYELGMFAGGVQLNNQLGGHIHFGFDTFNIFGFDKNNNINYTIYTKLAYVDEIIQKTIIYELSLLLGVPLACITDDDSLYVRHTPNSYGAFGSNEIKYYGLEWRMPSSWLVEPELCLCVLSVAYIIAYDAIERCYDIYNDEFNYLIQGDHYNVEHNIDTDLLMMKSHFNNVYQAERIYNGQDWGELHTFINDMHEYIKNMTIYKENVIYRDLADAFFIRVKSRRIIDKDQNILETWKATFTNHKE